MADKKFYYGGQAVIEGVMMRGKDNLVTAVRRPNGEIGVYPQLLAPLYTGRWRKTPFVRGVIVLIESLVLGIKTLMMSANVALEEEQEQMSPWMLWGTVIISLGFGVAVFFLLPLFTTRFFSSHAVALKESTLLFNFIEGLIRVAIFIIYLAAVSTMKDIRKVFAYHGAEHKAINTYEAGEPLEVAYARPHTTANPRCGTSFLFAVMVIAIIVFSIVGQPSIGYMAVSRILLLPVIAALAYEFIYYTSRHCENRLMKVLLTPGLWLQSLTTREPDDRQLEVALSALKKVLEIEQTPAATATPQPLATGAPA